MNTKQSTTKGFTLIELILVIAIMATLMMFVVSYHSDARKKARDSERIAELGKLAVSYDLFYSACKR